MSDDRYIDKLTIEEWRSSSASRRIWTLASMLQGFFLRVRARICPWDCDG